MSDSNTVPLPPSLRKRFYEPVLLLDALRYVYRKDNSLSEPDLESSVGRSPKQTYFCFLNKLSQICDSKAKQPLGETVSAIAVLDSGTIEYRLASNQRNARELGIVRAYLTDILSVLGHATDDEVNDRESRAAISSGILCRVLAFNRPRIEDYLYSLLREDRLAFCIRYASDDGTDEARSAAEALIQLQPHIDAANSASPLDDNEFARHAEGLLRTIDVHYASSLEEYMKTMADPHSPWSEVRHALGRLLSYFIAIKVLLSARKLWPRLFVDFTVITIPSSVPQAEPPVVRRNANGIINRMGRNKSTIEAYQKHAASLQSHGLDERIRQRAHPTRFRPIVHAEVLLLESVLRSRAAADRDGDGPLRFFQEADFGCYIASSKPTCLLCRAYFTAHPARVGCRDTHGNLYYNWRAPDVLPADGPDTARQRHDILEAMVKDIRSETARAIHERSYPRSRHDSRDTPSNPLGSTTVTASRAGDGDSVGARAAVSSSKRDEDFVKLAARMGQISLDAASMMGWRDDAEDDEDGDGGGVRL